MPAAVGPRFVLEAGFLVLLAVVVGFADLTPWLIILVMALGWLLVSLIEYFAWRQAQAAALARFEATPAPAVEEAALPPPPPPAEPPAEAETVVAPRPAESPEPEPPEPEPSQSDPAQPEPEPSQPDPAQPEPAKPEARPEEATTAFQPPPERRVAHRLEPLQPRPRRRWILFGPYERGSEPPAEGESEEGR